MSNSLYKFTFITVLIEVEIKSVSKLFFVIKTLLQGSNIISIFYIHCFLRFKKIQVNKYKTRRESKDWNAAKTRFFSKLFIDADNSSNMSIIALSLSHSLLLSPSLYLIELSFFLSSPSLHLCDFLNISHFWVSKIQISSFFPSSFFRLPLRRCD